MSTQKFKWQTLTAQYAFPDTRRSVWQVVNTVIPFFVLWYLAYRSLAVGYWLTLLLAVFAAGFMVRIFIIFHDCCHGAFFKSPEANNKLGMMLGVLVWTPFHEWKHNHAIHHATAGDLDRRGVGDVYTMTVDEYLAAPWHKKAAYRIMRNPLIMFTIGSFLVFTVFHRFWGPRAGKREKYSVLWTNLALAVVVGGLMALIGWKEFLLVEVPVLLVATSTGVWLFYVQHNFESTYWERHANWDFFRAAMEGSSFYKLPKVLQWFTGNIGFHHIHHLSPKIPNYKLEQCYNDNPELQVPPLTFRKSLRSLFLRLWDEKERKMVGWSALKKYKSQPAGA
ncbi:MAG: fatty acid desaturase [Chloroflexota bacterium]|nr:fatty acid desaturase [Chloroflexota bacterium]MBI5704887.1 fatty acid desaturase [Chloroflexota bacterium]